VVLVAVTILVFTGNDNSRPPPKREFDDRVTLRRSDKIPFGTYLAYKSLDHLFPGASVSTSKQQPGYWDSISNHTSGQAIIIITPTFIADEYEMKKLLYFIENGNDVFISSRSYSWAVENMTGAETSIIHQDNSVAGGPAPTTLRLMEPFYISEHWYSYKGLSFNSWFFTMDTTISQVLGRDEMKRPNFINFRAGKGNLYLHTAPIAFTNYFLLQGKNYGYYEKALSVISPEAHTIVWDEYFINKPGGFLNDEFGDGNSRGNEKGNFMQELFKYKELKWGLLTAILTLLLFVLMEMRRKQRFIPVITKPGNDSLDFVKTIGRLYYDKRDHRNLSYKMASYFLEFVRHKYKLVTTDLNEEFIKKLQFKTGISENEISDIIAFIREINTERTVTEKQMARFHRQLENFYEKVK
jgi:hypothetical protein